MSIFDILVQAVGLTGLVFGVLSFQSKRRNNILYMQVLSNALWVIHFFLLGAFTGAALNTVGGIRAAVFKRFSNKRRSGWLLFIVISLVVLAALLTWQGWMSLLPMFAMTIATVGFWQREEQLIRLILLFASPFWFTYNFLSGSYAGMLSEIIAILSISIALWRYRQKSLMLSAVQKTS